MKMLKCSANLRTVGIEFQLFVEGHTPKGQGDSERLGPNRFHINDFLDYLYRVDEFWEIPEVAVATMHAADETMMCPAGPAELTKRAGSPCGSTAIAPPRSVTLAANMRLYRAPMAFMGGTVLAPAALTRVRSSVLQHPYVPLVMDLDGPEAAARGLAPFYTAPSLGDDDESSYGTGRYWMPATRHGGATAVVFVSGSVLSSQQPEEEPWDWAYQADIGR